MSIERASDYLYIESGGNEDQETFEEGRSHLRCRIDFDQRTSKKAFQACRDLVMTTVKHVRDSRSNLTNRYARHSRHCWPRGNPKAISL
jgi:hypothetical protein